MNSMEDESEQEQQQVDQETYTTENKADIVQRALSGAYDTLVDPTYQKNVSEEAIRDLDILEKRLLDLAKISDLKMSKTTITHLRDSILSFVLKYQSEYMSGPNGISIKQDQFGSRLNAIIISLTTYLRLEMDMEAIRKNYIKLTSLNALVATSPEIRASLESKNLLNSSNGSNAHSFLGSVTRNTVNTLTELKGIPNVIESITSVLENIRFINPEYIFIILSGPPGTGKSSIAKGIATLWSEGKYYNFGIGELSNTQIGFVEKGIRDTFEKVERKTDGKVTFVFDEMDNLFSKLIKQPPHLQTVKITLQTEISGGRNLKNNVLLIGITNYYDTLEDVIKRRASRIIYVPIPPIELAFEFLINQTQLQSVIAPEFKNELFEMIKNRNNNKYTNANMKNIHKTAVSSYMQRHDTFNIVSNVNEVMILTSSLTKNITLNADSVKTMNVHKSHLPDKYTYIMIPEMEDYKRGLDGTAVMTNAQHEKYQLANDPDFLIKNDNIMSDDDDDDEKTTSGITEINVNCNCGNKFTTKGTVTNKSATEKKITDHTNQVKRVLVKKNAREKKGKAPQPTLSKQQEYEQRLQVVHASREISRMD